MKTPYIIGITGCAASGKSTFAKNLYELLGGEKVLLINMDSYFLPEVELPRAKAPITEVEYPDYNQPISQDLPKLKQDLNKLITTNEHKIIIIEGLWTLYDEHIRNLLHLKLFVDCLPDERAIRRLKRYHTGVNGPGIYPVDEIFGKMSDMYLDLVRYRQAELIEPTKWHADFIINGSNPSRKSLKIITNHIKGELL